MPSWIPTPTKKGGWTGDWSGASGLTTTPTPIRPTTSTPTISAPTISAPQSTGKPITVIPTLNPGQVQMEALLKKMVADVPSPQKYLDNLQRFIAQAMSGSPEAPPTPPAFQVPDMPTAQTFAEATKGMNLLEAEGPLDAEMIKALREAMSGRVSEEYFQKTIVDPATKAFREEIAPTLREEFVGPGTFWGGERAQAVEREGMKLADSIAAVRGTMAQSALDRQTTAALGYGELRATEKGQKLDLASRNYSTWMSAKSQDYATWSQTTAGSYNDWLDAKSQDYSTWRSGLSADLSTYMQGFIEANPTYADTINSIISYLNVPTMAAYQNPEYLPSAIQSALRGVS